MNLSVLALPSTNSRTTVVMEYMSQAKIVTMIAMRLRRIFLLDGRSCMIAIGDVKRSAPHCRRGVRPICLPLPAQVAVSRPPGEFRPC